MSDERDPIDAARIAEVRAGLDAVRARIQAACHAAGRSVDGVRLVVVTKTFPASDVRILASLGCTDVGENRDQEARAKRDDLGPLAEQVRWHMIGQVQRKKARSVAGWADVVESVDRLELAQALSRGAQAADRVVDALLQVSLDVPVIAERGGAAPDDVPALAEQVSALPGLRLTGVMAVAPHPGDPGEAFERLARIHALVQERVPGATEMSAGMSGDLEEAIAHGATQIRIGGAILGNRPPLR